MSAECCHDASGQQFRDPRKQRQQRIAAALQGIAENEDEAQGQIETHGNAEIGSCVFSDGSQIFGTGEEQKQKMRKYEPKHDKRKDAVCGKSGKSYPDPLGHPASVTGTEILDAAVTAATAVEP